MVREVFSELHEAFGVIEDAAREGQAARSHGGEPGAIVESMLITLEEPGLELVDVLGCKAKLLAYADGDPGALAMSSFKVVREGFSSIVEGTQPNLQSIAEAITLVLEVYNSLLKQLVIVNRVIGLVAGDILPGQGGYEG